MEFVNLTPHQISVYLPDDTVRLLPPSGQIARLVDPSGPRHVQPLGDLPAALYTPLEGRRLDGLPPPKSGTVYVCSILCLSAALALGRLDVVAPDTDSGSVRVPRGEPNAGALLGTTRLLLAGDGPPAYRLVTGSATHDGAAPRDLDLFGWRHSEGELPLAMPALARVCWPAGTALTPGSVDVTAREAVERARRGDLPIDYHAVCPVLGADGAWEIRVPVWAEEDPSQPTLLWHSPCAREVRVVRDVLTTGPAQLRCYAATGVLPDYTVHGLADHGRTGNLVVELRCDGEAPGYRGCGLLAWRRAASRLSPAQIAALPAHVYAFVGTLLAYGEEDMRDIADMASAAVALRRSGALPSADSDSSEIRRHRDTCCMPGSSDSVTYYWDPSEERWMTPYAYASDVGGYGYDTFADVLAVWS